MSFKVETKIDKTRVADLLCSAFEGGANYWYMIVSQKAPTTFDFYSFPVANRGEVAEIFPHIDYPLNEGGNVVIETLEKDKINGKKKWILDLDSIQKGLQIFADKYPDHFSNFMTENEDAVTGDVFLQCCLFGEVVFA